MTTKPPVLARLAASRWLSSTPWDQSPELEPPTAPAEPERCLRLLTLNVAHGRKLSTHQALLSPAVVRQNLEEIAALLRESRSDVIALQEADGPSAWSGNFDHVALLSTLTDCCAHYRGEHNAFNLGGTALASGTALLSRLPFRETRSHRFGTSWRDTKGFVLATLSVEPWGGCEVDVVSLHLEPFNPVIRRQQVHALSQTLQPRHRPLVVLGDFNCTWSEQAKQLRPLAKDLGLRPFQPHRRAPTYPSRRPWRRLDWILISPELEFVGYRTLPNPVSDHLGVVADLALRDAQPRSGQGKGAEDDPAA